MMMEFDFNEDFQVFQDFNSCFESDNSTDIELNEDMEKYENVSKVEIFQDFDWISSQEVNEMAEDESQDFIIHPLETAFEEGYWIAKSKDRYFILVFSSWFLMIFNRITLMAEIHDLVRNMVNQVNSLKVPELKIVCRKTSKTR